MIMAVRFMPWQGGGAQPWKRIGLFTLLAATATLYAAADLQAQMSVAQIAPPASNRQAVMIEQIQPPGRHAPTKVEAVPHRPVGVKEAAATLQLPPDLDSVSDDPEQETALTSPETTAPNLLNDVARAWHVIRSRGQQPTPELIAREIGPDALTAFLNQYPNGVALITAQEAPTPPPPPDLPPDQRN